MGIPWYQSSHWLLHSSSACFSRSLHCICNGVCQAHHRFRIYRCHSSLLGVGILKYPCCAVFVAVTSYLHVGACLCLHCIAYVAWVASFFFANGILRDTISFATPRVALSTRRLSRSRSRRASEITRYCIAFATVLTLFFIALSHLNWVSAYFYCTAFASGVTSVFHDTNVFNDAIAFVKVRN